MATFIRPSFRAAAVTVAGAGAAYQTYRYFGTQSPFVKDVYAETLPSETQATLKKMAWKGFTQLKLESAEMYNHNVKKLTFALPDDQTVSGLSPITSLLSQHTPEGGWIPVIRPYTPISSNDQPGTITFLVKRYDGGKGSGKMHSLVPGDTMKFKPLNEFEYKPNQFAHMTLIAGGSGITPIYQLTNAILQNPADTTKISLIYANNSPEDVLLKAEFDELERKYPDRFQKLLTVSRNGGSDGLHQGYVTKELLTKASPGKSDKVLISGPPPMVEAIAGARGGFGWTQGSLGGVLKELGYTKEEIHKF